MAMLVMSMGPFSTQAADLSAWDPNTVETGVMDYLWGPIRRSQAKDIFFAVLMASSVTRHECVLSAGLLACLHCQNMRSPSDPHQGLFERLEARRPR